MVAEMTMWHREISDLARTVEKRRTKKYHSAQDEEAARTRELILDYLEQPRTIPALVEFTALHRDRIYWHVKELAADQLIIKEKCGREVIYQRRNHV